MAPRNTDQLLRDVAKLQEEVAQLRKQRNEKEAELVSIKADKKVSSLANTTAAATTTTTTAKKANKNDDAPSLKDYGIEDTDSSAILLASSAALAADAESWQLESLYRMSGITTFAVKDPGPDRTDLLGVRIEIFVGRTFKTPYYLILSPYEPTSSSKGGSSSSNTSTNPLSTPSSLRNLSKVHVVPHKHTVPSFLVPYYDSLCETHLPPPPRPQSLIHVATGIRRALTLYHARLYYMEEIERRVNEPPGIEDNSGVKVSGFKVDPEAKLAIVEWKKSTVTDDDDDSENEGNDDEEATRMTASIAITDEGGIDSVVVKEKGKRVRTMERQISDGDNSQNKKKTLAQVLGEEDKYVMPISGLADRLVWNSGDSGGDDGDISAL